MIKKVKDIYRKIFLKKAGFTLLELMMAIAISIIVLVGLLQTFIYSFGFSWSLGNTIVAISDAQGKLEEIRNHNFYRIVTDYSSSGNPGNTFNLIQLDGKGVIYIDNTNPNLLEVEIAVSWQEKNRRIIGEDTNLNGALDANEDSDGNGKLDSPVSLVTLIVRK